MTEVETLINTLLENGLAASRSEAQRMAQDMMATSDKVNESMRNQKDNLMVKSYGANRQQAQQPTPQPAPIQEPQPVPQGPISGTPREQKIEELRRSALNPQLVQVQTDFDTPQNDMRRTDFSAEPSLPSQEATVEVNHSDETPLENNFAEPSEPEKPQMTPEDYAARQMNGMGAQTVSDLTSEPVAQPMSSSLESSFSEPEEQPISHDFISQAPQEHLEQPLDIPLNPVQEPLEPQLPIQEPRAALEPQIPTFEETRASLDTQVPQSQEMPQEAPQQNQEPEQPAPEKKKAQFTPEEEKLAQDVDLSKVFNFSNK
ncbi:MAG: hypothetical protein KC535_03440 [Nanoarchaeota archaeon]|nr:hypothetical protein [Nanoarchaeota archaeon]